MAKLYETSHLYIEQPWPNAGLRIIDKYTDAPYWPSGAFYDNMGSPYKSASALECAIAAADSIQHDIDSRD